MFETVLLWIWNIGHLQAVYIAIRNLQTSRRISKLEDDKLNSFGDAMFRRDVAVEAGRLVGLVFNLAVGLLAWFTEDAFLAKFIEVGIVIGAFSLIFNANVMYVGNRAMAKHLKEVKDSIGPSK